MTSFLKPGGEHHISEIRSQWTLTLRCKCGWFYSIARTQHALARAAEVRAAIHKHEREVTKSRVYAMT